MARFPGQVVIKTLENPKRHGRFATEVQPFEEVDDPGVIRIIDDDLEADPAYLVTAYCEAGSLDQRRGWMTDKRRIREVLLQVCAGVAVVHSLGITHRDLKPATVLLRSDDAPPLYATSVFATSTETSDTLTEEAAGPRNYMAPELEDGRADRVGAASDVYSLGKLLYWMCAGKIFACEKRRQSEWSLHVLFQNRDLARANLHLLDRMIVADRERRFQDATKVAETVRTVIRRMNERKNVIAKNIPQYCAYCGLGQTVEVAEGPDGGKRFGVEGIGGLRWRIYQCNYCGQVEFLRVDSSALQARWNRPDSTPEEE